MSEIAQHEAAPSAIHLPMWWRCLLIVLGMVILCACSAPVTRTHLAPDKALQDMRSVGRNAAQPPMAAPIVEQVLPPEGMELEPETISIDDGAPEGAVCDDSDTVVDGEAVVADGQGGACGPNEFGADGAFDADGCVATDPYGPVLGPGDEYLCDGGDFVTPVGVHADWSITGLEQEDAIAHYDTVDGRVITTPSNRVCIYAPRFAAVRRVVQPIAHEQPVFINQTLEELSPAKAAEAQPVVMQKQRQGLAVDMGQQPPSLFRQRQQAGGTENLQATMDAFNSLAAYANLTIIRTGEVSAAEKALVERATQAAIAWTGVQAAQVLFGVKQAHAEVGVRQPGVVYGSTGPESPKLCLVKLASRGDAQPGEEVEFTLRFDNIGDQVIGNVTIVDNLSTRLEYVPNTAKSSVDADFLTQSNDAGSLILRWEIKDPVKPGEGGILQFRTKVR
jgi:uncharacterized repeat protein (TIGR01451 family)